MEGKDSVDFVDEKESAEMLLFQLVPGEALAAEFIDLSEASPTPSSSKEFKGDCNLSSKATG